MRMLPQSVINSELDPDAFVKDFTEDRIIIQTEERDAAGKQVDVIEEIPYRISLETSEIILDPENIKRIERANDNPVAKQQREDLRFVSPALAKKLRDENFKK